MEIEDVFFILKNKRRRLAIKYISNNDDIGVDINLLASLIARDVFGDKYSGDDRKKIYIGLKQTHIPKLHEEEIVDFDNRRVVKANKECHLLNNISDRLDDMIKEELEKL